MPIYEYKCNACGREFEYQQRMTDPDHTDVRGLSDEDKLEKLISRTAFQLKGGGWYKDLYASTPAAPSGGAVDKSTPSTATPATPASPAPAAAPASPAPSTSSGAAPARVARAAAADRPAAAASGSAAASRQS